MKKYSCHKVVFLCAILFTATAGAYAASGKGVASPAMPAGIAEAATPALMALDATATAAAQAYTSHIDTTYQYPFGDGQRFLPSNAISASGGFIDPKLFPTAEYCSHCHQASYHQWRESAHANSFRAPWYIKNVNLLTKEKGISYTRHCEGCHNPIALMSGALTPDAHVNRGFDQDGVTCMTCHSIQKVEKRGTGNYVMGTPTVLLDANGAAILGPVSDAEILAHLDRHSAAVMKPFYRTSEMCASCHKAALPHQLNDYKWQRAFFVYDEWQLSSFAKQSPLPFYSKDKVSTCETCHMTREPLVGSDPGAKDGMLASHRWIGANTMLPTQFGYPEQLQKTIAFLQAGVFNVDIFGLEKESSESSHSDGPHDVTSPLGAAPFELEPNKNVTLTVLIQNKGIAHSHVPEQRDMYESWVEFEAKDAGGHSLYHSGYLQPDGRLDPHAHSFTNRLINTRGELNAEHQVWNTHVVAYNNTIQSGRTQLVRYQFHIPQDAQFPISVSASVKYRRFNQHFIDFGLGKHTVEPVVAMTTRTRVLARGTNPAVPPEPTDNPTWMRWNNYGIALLDAQQYEASVHAFEQVSRLRPDYADAYTNIALADFQWQRYEASGIALEKALQLSPNNARALYYMALVERNRGNLDAAITDLEKVIAAFPRSRDAHRELGFSYYQQHNYSEACREYETLQDIDPDDQAAHYILSIVYRRLGMTDKAHAQAAMFADQKDDPGASTYAFQYLRKHPETALESVPWHTHGDTTGASGTAQLPGQSGMAPGFTEALPQ